MDYGEQPRRMVVTLCGAMGHGTVLVQKTRSPRERGVKQGVGDTSVAADRHTAHERLQTNVVRHVRGIDMPRPAPHLYTKEKHLENYGEHLGVSGGEEPTGLAAGGWKQEENPMYCRVIHQILAAKEYTEDGGERAAGRGVSG
ncbi:hypothetical protein B0H16DRAFT_1693425 [Mycena metata]|uniref:Uncharacterized protein n=1 Tax=Mycena metata TaxID=1033252 RepID=A0AAD7IHY5_9AGAR|nr:hypothetical protein B0H16DRAFT_1693425 [Mycena metata]